MRVSHCKLRMWIRWHRRKVRQRPNCLATLFGDPWCRQPICDWDFLGLPRTNLFKKTLPAWHQPYPFAFSVVGIDFRKCTIRPISEIICFSDSSQNPEFGPCHAYPQHHANICDLFNLQPKNRFSNVPRISPTSSIVAPSFFRHLWPPLWAAVMSHLITRVSCRQAQREWSHCLPRYPWMPGRQVLWPISGRNNTNPPNDAKNGGISGSFDRQDFFSSSPCHGRYNIECYWTLLGFGCRAWQPASPLAHQWRVQCASQGAARSVPERSWACWLALPRIPLEFPRNFAH